MHTLQEHMRKFQIILISVLTWGVYKKFFFTILKEIKKYAVLREKCDIFKFFILLGRSELRRDFFTFQIT